MSTTGDPGAVVRPRHEHVPPTIEQPTDRPLRAVAEDEQSVRPEAAVGPADEAALRASDAERAETVDRLHQALGAGRLDLVETDERVTAAYAARHRHELSALLTDLPITDSTFSTVPSWPGLWTLAVWRIRIVLTGDPRTARPTSGQLRTAALLTVLAVVWMAACAVLGAAAVGA